MSNLATITNNILADSGIDDINVIVSTGSYANPAWITSFAWTKITGAPTSIVTGTGVAGQVAYWSSTSAITGESQFVWDAANNRLGIGQASPLANIHINTNLSDTPAELILSNGGQSLPPSDLGILWFGSAEGDGWRAAAIKGTAEQDFNTSSWTTSLNFWTTYASATPVMRLNISSTGVSSFYGDNAATAVSIGLAGGGTKADFSVTENVGVALNVNEGASARSFDLQIAGTSAMFVNTSRNIGVGVSPSTWSVGRAVEIGNLGNAFWSEANGEAWILSNAYYDSAFRYANAIAAGAYNISKNVHRWYTAPSGTLGSAISFTNSMTLSAGGLDVGGTGYFTSTLTGAGLVSETIGDANTIANTAGWYKIGSINSRGGGRITLSFTGGNFAPVTYVIYYYKNWSNEATLKLEKYGTTNYITEARIRLDAADSIYYIEIYVISQPTAPNFRVYHDKILGYNATGTAFTGVLSAGSVTGTTITSASFVTGITVANLLSNDTITSGGALTAGSGTFITTATTGTTTLLTLSRNSGGWGQTAFKQSYHSTYFTNGKTLSLANDSGTDFAHFAGNNAGTQTNFILPTGNIGLGENIPTDRIYIKSATGDAGITLQSVSGGQTLRIDQNSIRTSTTSPINIFTNNTSGVNSLYIENDGRFGIGTTAPTAGMKLDVSGRIRAFTGSSGVSPRTDLGGTIIAEGTTRAGLYILTEGTAAGSYGSIWWGNGNTNTDGFISVENNTRAMRFGTADGTRMSILSNGFVGIDTVSPAARLDVNGNGIFRVADGATNTGGFTITNDGTSSIVGPWGLNSSPIFFVNTGTVADAHIAANQSTEDTNGVIFRGYKSRGTPTANNSVLNGDDILTIDAWALQTAGPNVYKFGGGMTWYKDDGGGTANTFAPMSLRWRMANSTTTTITPMTLLYDGRLLIGTQTAPAAVAGVSFPLTISSSAATRLRIDSTNASPNSGVGLYANGVQKFSFAMYGATSDFTIYNDALLSPSVTVKGTNSNVLIGTTDDNGSKLRVAGGIGFFDSGIKTGTLDTGYVAGTWKLGRALIGTQPSETYQIIVEINGQLFSIGAALI